MGALLDLDGSSQGVRVDSLGEGILLAGSAVNLRVRHLRPLASMLTSLVSVMFLPRFASPRRSSCVAQPEPIGFAPCSPPSSTEAWDFTPMVYHIRFVDAFFFTLAVVSHAYGRLQRMAHFSTTIGLAGALPLLVAAQDSHAKYVQTQDGVETAALASCHCMSRILETLTAQSIAASYSLFVTCPRFMIHDI